MFDAKFTTSDGKSISFGYAAGVLYSIDPIGDLSIELETSQSFQQVGAVVESRSIAGVTRTVTGRILRNSVYLKKQIRDIFAPFVTGRLTIAGKYYCDCEVSRCPAISAADLWPTFSFDLYCPSPYWSSVAETSTSSQKSAGTFTLPVCYDSHQYGTRSQTDYLAIKNAGLKTQDFTLTLTAHGDVENPGVTDTNSGESLKFNAVLAEDEQIKVYRENGVLYVVQVRDGVEYNAFSTLDESSDLFTLDHGDVTWMRTADSGADKLVMDIDFSAAFASLVVDGGGVSSE